MFLGRFQQGDDLPVEALVRTGLTPSWPAAAPTVQVVGSAGTVLATIRLTPVERSGAVGLFAGSLFLDSRFPAGNYAALATWSGGGLLATFQVVPGGDVAGHVNSMFWVDRPWASMVLLGLDSGRLRKRTNPRL